MKRIKRTHASRKDNMWSMPRKPQYSWSRVAECSRAWSERYFSSPWETGSLLSGYYQWYEDDK